MKINHLQLLHFIQFDANIKKQERERKKERAFNTAEIT